MRYVSTRGRPDEPGASFCDILLEGLAADGGLFVPERYPQLDADTLSRWRVVLAEQGYAELAYQVMSLFVDDIPAADLSDLCRRAYTPQKFGSDQIVPVTRLSDGLWLGELANGPSAAFKDMAMQLLGELFEYELARRDQELNILGATSGDTGSSAEYAMLGKSRVRVFMLSPRGRMTPFQQAQMFSLDDPGIVNMAVDGVFDDCQDIVKAVSGDLAFKERHSIGVVNSINWARLVAQVVYYVACWLRVTEATGSGETGTVSFAVPTGNFGNICAGHVARSMGLPIDTLVLATNENDVLDEFFRTGVYRVRGGGEVHQTSSPSMDISKASNVERFIYDLLGRDGTRVRELFVDQLGAESAFDLSAEPGFVTCTERFGIVSGSSSHADRLRTIAEVYATDQVLIDPHTADAVHVARCARDSGLATAPVVALSTALPVKFAATIREAIGQDPPLPPRFVGIEQAEWHVVDVDNDAEQVKRVIEERLS